MAIRQVSMLDWQKRIILAGGLAALILGSAGTFLLLGTGGPPAEENRKTGSLPGGSSPEEGFGSFAERIQGPGSPRSRAPSSSPDDNGGASGEKGISPLASSRQEKRAARKAERQASLEASAAGREGRRQGKLRPQDIPDSMITEKLLQKALQQNSGPLAEALERALQEEDSGPLLGLLIANLTEKGTNFSPEEVPQLLDALKGESSHEVQSLLLKHLERIDAPQEKLNGYLSYLKESESPSHADEVVGLLAKTKSPEAVDGLIEILDQGELPRSRRRIMEALGEMGDPVAVESLSKVLENPENRAEQGISLKALASIGDKTAVAAILGYASQENNRFALQAIEQIDTRKNPDAVPILGDALLERSYPAYQLAILRKLSSSGDPRIERSVQRAIDQTDNRQVLAAAVDSLSRFGTKKSIAFFQEKINQSPDPNTQKVYLRAMRRIQMRLEAKRGRG